MKLNRNQLAKFLPDNEAIRIFEGINDTADKAYSSAGTVTSLSADASINSATLTDAGLNASLIQNNVYQFEFFVPYAVAGSVGTVWTISGPAASFLAYQSRYSLSSTGDTVNNKAVYDSPTTANASSASATGNIAVIRGFVIPSESGQLKLRCASSGEITIKRGANVRLIRLT